MHTWAPILIRESVVNHFPLVREMTFTDLRAVIDALTPEQVTAFVAEHPIAAALVPDAKMWEARARNASAAADSAERERDELREKLRAAEAERVKSERWAANLHDDLVVANCRIAQLEPVAYRVIALRDAKDRALRLPTHGLIDDALTALVTPTAEPAPTAEPHAVPREVHESGWQWRPVGDGAFAPPFGTIRVCRGCGCLVAGGPTACARCAEAPLAESDAATVSIYAATVATCLSEVARALDGSSRWESDTAKRLLGWAAEWRAKGLRP